MTSLFDGIKIDPKKRTGPMTPKPIYQAPLKNKEGKFLPMTYVPGRTAPSYAHTPKSVSRPKIG